MSDKQKFKMTGGFPDLSGVEWRDIPTADTNEALLKWRQEVMGPQTFKTLFVETKDDGKVVLTLVPYAEGETPPPRPAAPVPDLWVCYVPLTGADFCGENEGMVKEHAAIHNSDDELVRLGGGRMTVRPFYAAPPGAERGA